MTTRREDAMFAIVGLTLYVFGGRDGTSNLATIEKATISFDGTLGAFSQGTTPISLSVARRGGCVVVIRNNVYLIGGGVGASDGPSTSVDLCTINSNGEITSNCTANMVPAMQNPRKNPACAVIGNQLFVMGGDSFGSVEVSNIAPNGSLVGFGPQAGSQTRARSNHAALQFGNFLHLLGGDTGVGGVQANGESAVLQ
jgi:N-acetylneuraminic acid mutarotase